MPAVIAQAAIAWMLAGLAQADEVVVRELLGLELSETESRIRRSLISTRTPYGFLIAGVRPSSPAARAGLRPGDILLKWDGVPIHEIEELANSARSVRARSGSAPVEYARKRDHVRLTFPATDPWETRRTRIRLATAPARPVGPI